MPRAASRLVAGRLGLIGPENGRHFWFFQLEIHIYNYGNSCRLSEKSGKSKSLAGLRMCRSLVLRVAPNGADGVRCYWNEEETCRRTTRTPADHAEQFAHKSGF